MAKQSYSKEGLYARINKQKVTESYDICKEVEGKKKCMSRQYLNPNKNRMDSLFVRVPQVLGNGECMYCWDKNASKFYDNKLE